MSGSGFRVGLTGGIASGKSTVGNILRQMGAVVIDTDAIAREVVQPGSASLQEIHRRYGETILDSFGRLRRDKLAAIIFDSPTEKAWLEGLLHPLIRQKAEEQARFAFESGCRVVFFEVPLLFESGWDQHVDCIWTVYVPPNVQRERLMGRDSLNEAEAESRLRSQWPIDRKAELADVVIGNSESPECTRQQVFKAWNKLLECLAERQDGERSLS